MRQWEPQEPRSETLYIMVYGLKICRDGLGSQLSSSDLAESCLSGDIGWLLEELGNDRTWSGESKLSGEEVSGSKQSEIFSF